MSKYSEFIKDWAVKAWNLSIDFDGTMSGGIDPPKKMVGLPAIKGAAVEIKYTLPKTCGLSDVRYHVTEPDKVRTDVFAFSEAGDITMNGVPFPGPFAEHPWTAKEAHTFLWEYGAARMELED